MKLFVIVLSFLISTNLFAQVEVSGNVYSGTYLPNFYINFADYKGDSDGKTRVDAFFQVPYGSVQFKKVNNNYQAAYSISLSFYDEDKDNILFEKYWNETIVSDQFNQTFSKQNYNISYKSFELKPEKYAVVCIVEDQNSSTKINFEKVVEVREFDDPISISDIVLVKKRIKVGEQEQVVPSVSNIFNTEQKDLDMFFEIYSDKEEEVLINYKVIDAKKEKAHTQSDIISLKPGANFISHNMKNINLILGKYKLQIELKDKDDDVVAEHNLLFRSAIPGFPISIVDLDEAIEQLEYIANGSIIDSLEEAETLDEKMEYFKAFWKSKDPSPNTSENEVMLEYYRRIDYANKHFKGYSGGWRSDMGMVYVMLGPPSQVYREPLAIDSRPYEYWQYDSIQRTFLFIDQTGFGDYRLANRDYGDWYRYRQ